jgi:UDP-N-acetyl-D-glucosamine dehydrogenase
MQTGAPLTETTSTAPNGEQFPLPTPQDEATEIPRLQALVAEHRAQGHEIVVVLGVGFVGAVMTGIVADSGTPTKFVIGMQRPSPRSYWKIPLLNRGIAPVEAGDPEVAPLIARCVLEKKTLTATYTLCSYGSKNVVNYPGTPG